MIQKHDSIGFRGGLILAAAVLQAASGCFYPEARVRPDVYVHCERSPSYSPKHHSRSFRIPKEQARSVESQKLLKLLEDRLLARSKTISAEAEICISARQWKDEHKITLPERFTTHSYSRTLVGDVAVPTRTASETIIPMERLLRYFNVQVSASTTDNVELWFGTARTEITPRMIVSMDFLLDSLVSRYGEEFDGMIWSPSTLALKERQEAQRQKEFKRTRVVMMIAVGAAIIGVAASVSQ